MSTLPPQIDAETLHLYAGDHAVCEPTSSPSLVQVTTDGHGRYLMSYEAWTEYVRLCRAQPSRALEALALEI